MLEVRFDYEQTILSVKEAIEKRYGTSPDSCQLVLQDKEGNTLAHMSNEKQLGFYSPQDGYWIYIIDQNPDSVLNDLEDTSKVEKYKISDQDYDNLPDNFRKFKVKMIQSGAIKQNIPPVWDEDYQKEEAEKIKVGDRCQIIETGSRGEVRYVGKVTNKGSGYFVGVKLDEPVGNTDGKYLSTQYFECLDKYGIFLRPDKIEVGDFPEVDLLDDEI